MVLTQDSPTEERAHTHVLSVIDQPKGLSPLHQDWFDLELGFYFCFQTHDQDNTLAFYQLFFGLSVPDLYT